MGSEPLSLPAIRIFPRFTPSDPSPYPVYKMWTERVWREPVRVRATPQLPPVDAMGPAKETSPSVPQGEGRLPCSHTESGPPIRSRSGYGQATLRSRARLIPRCERCSGMCPASRLHRPRRPYENAHTRSTLGATFTAVMALTLIGCGGDGPTTVDPPPPPPPPRHRRWRHPLGRSCGVEAVLMAGCSVSMRTDHPRPRSPREQWMRETFHPMERRLRMPIFSGQRRATS